MQHNYYGLEVMMRQHQQDILRDAEMRRRARMATQVRAADRAGSEVWTSSRRTQGLLLLAASVLTGLGKFLLRVGRRLESRPGRVLRDARGGGRSATPPSGHPRLRDPVSAEQG